MAKGVGLKGLKGWWSLILMPVYATLQNTLSDIRCSKCKKTQDPIYFTQHGKLYKTCNECRVRDVRRRASRLRDNFWNYNTGDEDAVNAVLALSSSAAASASTSSTDYFVAEPDPEPEPESP